MDIKLTSLSSCAGWAAKFSPSDLSQVLGQLPEITDPNVLVGTSNADDAGVYKISNDTAIVLTADYFTPIVDDPYWFGAIAAANALSDVWAMGGKPIVALNIACFPGKPEFVPLLKQIVKGGIDKMSEAGVSIIGGHTIKDNEPKYGFTVMGTVHPDKILDNSMAKPGDAVVLTKKIGTGVVSTGIKRNISGKDSEEEITRSMAELNRRACEIMIEIGVSTATDITGFGLMGHLHEVMLASNCSSRLYSTKVPYFDDAIRLASENVVPGGTIANLKNYSQYARWDNSVKDYEKILINDAQTSGGLLIFVPGGKKDSLVSSLEREGILAAYIGDVIGKQDINEKIRIDVVSE